AQPLPAWLKGPSEERGKCREQQDKEFWRLRLPAGQAMDKRQWARRASVSCFRYNVPDELDAGSELPLGRSWQAGAQDPRDTLYWYLFLVRAGGEVELFPVQFNESAAGLF
ncbi:MAG: hypothetical protein LBB49_02235, partial [Gracilibacteraceae bacterium]|nr:hypothetical protein [Gracilibacteraceae bacterium]